MITRRKPIPKPAPVPEPPDLTEQQIDRLIAKHEDAIRLLRELLASYAQERK